MLNPTKHSFKYGKHTVTIETGVIARQADTSALVNMNETIVLVTAVYSKQIKQPQALFPLTVNYQERTYAAGRIPSGFYRREGRPSESEILISRLIDRPIRPLFPDSFLNEVQIFATVLSLNPQVTTDIVSLIGVSVVLSLSELPFNGPFGVARVCYVNDKYLLSSDITGQTASSLDLIVVGSSNSILMVESQTKLLNEQQVLEAILFGYKEQQKVVNNINELTKRPCNKSCIHKNYSSNIEYIFLKAKVTKLAEPRIFEAYQNTNKKERFSSIELIKLDILNSITDSRIPSIILSLERNIMSSYLLKKGIRIDGRNKKAIRNLNIRIGFLPRTHGSALFTRGETQALVTVTLGNQRNAQNVDELKGERIDRFLFHYNFPPFCVGEVGIIGSPKRREVGHGWLAKRSLLPIIPEDNIFPYTVRIVSEITESNGSSSMASVCGASLALMDAGVPICFPIAGISIGLIKETNNYLLLSDIIGDEDHLGDMDLKASGTKAGMTAIQMDIKIQEPVYKTIIDLALKQARSSIYFILDIMNKSISSSRKTIGKYAPKLYTINISPDKIKSVVGKGGSIIKSLIEETNTNIDISDAGMITIYSSNDNMANIALNKIKEITSDIKIGNTYSSKVIRIVEFGVYVIYCGYKEGLVHISHIANRYISKVSDHLTIGQEVLVKVLDIDRFGKVKLSIKEASNPAISNISNKLKPK
ncbi:polyribonucleotide nucleotidyltransferase [Candidatus Tremblaya phenacola]|uniref:polyribonucleotide nucleotidyltransferase n=1 Tax=Candidatus Tremblayella phenacoccinincola TaxID=1010676 RepID=UPI00132F72D2|nr:polyribonucleotide nucleotidyltransferase [Candidatus Tremblaya phenacola]KAH0998233.1 Polyribonucleotide nucleotidyltransferase [Candidatus Tremblaya phenacola]